MVKIMKINLDGNDSKIVKKNKTYTLIDNTDLNKLVVSKTILHPKQETTGHAHEGQEEVYHFLSGNGKMQIGVIKVVYGNGKIYVKVSQLKI